jgi:tetrahydromethanopterin S-methyltransferase subunit G
MKEQLEQQKQQLEDELFYEQMKDYIDWDNYNEMKAQLKEIDNKLEALN